jgi:sugar/nucleoside kinase (ribokinase family)
MSGPAARFAVVGDALLDISVRHRVELELGGDVPAEVIIGPGGQGANVAVRLARLGAEVTLVAAMGADRSGQMLRAALEEETMALALVTTGSTGSVVVLTDADGERTMLSQRVSFADDAALPTGPQWIVVSGYALLETAGLGLAARIATLDARRVLLGCDVPADEHARWLEAARLLRPQLAVLNRAEAMRIGGSPSDELAALASAASIALGCSVVVTTATAAVATMDEGAPLVVRGVAGAPPVDTTGAGDACAARLLAELADGPWPPPREMCAAALGAAMAHAGAVTRVVGAQGRVPGERPPRGARTAARER